MDSFFIPPMDKKTKTKPKEDLPKRIPLPAPKVMVLVIGLPGAKDKLAADITHRYGVTNALVSADDWFVGENTGKYFFRGEEVQNSHVFSRKCAMSHMKTNIPLVIINNTNLKTADRAPYFAMANKYGYHVMVVSAFEDNLTKSMTMAECNSKSNVPFETLKRMLASYEAFDKLYEL